MTIHSTFYSPTIGNIKQLVSLIEIAKPVWNHIWKYLNPKKPDLSPALPSELWVRIMEELKPQEVLSLSETCRRMQSLALDQYVWTRFAKKEHLYVGPGLTAMQQFRQLFTAEKKIQAFEPRGNSELRHKIAKSIGPSRFLDLLEIWEKRKLSGGGVQENHSLTLINFGRDALRIKCKEVDTGHDFEMKIIDAKEQDRVIIYFGSLSPILLSKGLDFKRAHNKMEMNQSLFDYLTRLVHGERCGLLLNGREETNFLVQLAG